jgi:outer membrane murein-binding lipoprotein Lpp
MRRIGVLAAVLVSGSLLITGCGSSGSTAPSPETKAKMEDMTKKHVEMMAKTKGKIPGTPGTLPGAPAAPK